MLAHARALEEGWTAAAEGLRVFATPPVWLTALGDPARVASALARRVPELALGELTLKTCEVTQVRIREDALSTLYRVVVEAGNGRPPREMNLRGRFVPPGWPEPDVGTDGGLLGSCAWHCWIPELRLDITTEAPDDPALPALSSLTDPAEACLLLERAIRAGCPRYADLRIEACSPHVVRYKRGSRCTIIYRLRFPPGAPSRSWPETVVAKTHRGEKGRNAYECMRALWNSELRSSRNVTIAEPLAFLSEPSVLIQAGIPHGRTLKELLRTSLPARTPRAMDDLASYLAKTAAGLADLHASGVRPAGVVTWEDELAEIRALLARLGELIPELTEAATPLLARLEALAREHPADSLRPAHRSFRPAQVLLDGGAIGFIDFDGFCQAEPAIDVALFRAIVKDVGLDALQAEEGSGADGQALPEHMAQLDDLCDAFSVLYEAIAPISRRRVALWEALDLLTLVAHSWTKVKFDRLGNRLALLRHHLRASELD
jgi:hypothetical protein